ncbi:Endosulphine [Dillenia turbinata]|uniref:Endosulphine n=1 Tax=Dillenia turbinata TaxID=194707 RepID=A0AAN8VK95_9MAGN
MSTSKDLHTKTRETGGEAFYICSQGIRMREQREEASKMSVSATDNAKDEGLRSNMLEDPVDSNAVEEIRQAEENPVPSLQQEEEIIKKKYGGMVPKKPPLISKDHERAYFDSADWALGKQGAQKPKGPLEALRPKLQPTPHHQMRRSAYAPDSCEVDGDAANIENTSTEDHSKTLDGSSNADDNTLASDAQSLPCHE